MAYPEYRLTNATGVSISSAITILQLKAGVNGPIEIMRWHISQSTSTTSAQVLAGLVRKTGAATVTQAVVGTTLFKQNPVNPTPDVSISSSATGITASGEGTNGDICDLRAFNVLTGAEVLYTPDERIVVPQAGIIGLVFMSSPASATWYAEIVFREMRGG